MWYEPRGYPGPFDKSMKNPAVGTRSGKRVERAFPVKLIEDEGKRCAAYRLLFARRFPNRALSSRRRAVRERVTNGLAPIAPLALPSHKGSFVKRCEECFGINRLISSPRAC